jgi:hypothetical protein
MPYIIYIFAALAKAFAAKAFITFPTSITFPTLNNESIRQYRAFLNYHYSIFHCIKGMIGVGKMWSSVDPDIIAYAAVLINDGVADITSLPDA